ncbi:MAG: RdgB/HAM1 family non-canonical purine NTP pyrophosphatase [Bacteroidota bacterium]
MATNNRHKAQEIAQIMGDSFELVTLQDIGCHEELAEEQDTIAGNSFQKADYVFRKYGIAVFADDSGLEVEALNGAPGVNSAYYAGAQKSFADNVALLLKNMQGVSNRRASFVTVVTLISPSGTQQFEGRLKGTILTEPRGTGGFGYDPVFLPDGFGHTLAEMSLEEKNKISHRSLAIAQLVKHLKSMI